MSIEKIKELNPEIKLKSVDDKAFQTYGKILNDFDFNEIIKYSEENIIIPKTGNMYEASVKALESFPITEELRMNVYGGIEIELGFCCGNNTQLTGVEYHQGSEVTIAVTDCILILGRLQDIQDNQYDTSKVEYFYLSKGQAVELYGTTLHYSPCTVQEEGFMTLVALIRGTNSLLGGSKVSNVLVSKINKFLMVHPSQKEKITNGIHNGLVGNMPEIKHK